MNSVTVFALEQKEHEVSHYPGNFFNDIWCPLLVPQSAAQAYDAYEGIE